MELFWCDAGPWLADSRPADRFRDRAGIREEIRCREELILHTAGRYLLAEGFRRRCSGVPMPPLTADGNGKPRFAGEGPHFSISHAGRAVLCALDDRALGVDVEPLAPVEPALWGALSPRERDYAARRSGREQSRAFYRIWTRKESLVKATGEGLGALPWLESVVTPGLRLRRKVGEWYLRELPLPLPGYVASAALAAPQAVEVIKVDLPLL